MSRALDIANDLSTFGPKYESGTLDAVSLTNSVVDAGQLLGLDLSGLANAGSYVNVNVTSPQDNQILQFNSGVLVNQALSAGAIDHDSLLNFVSDEHINWKSTTENFSTTGTFASGVVTITNNNTTDSLLIQTTENSSTAAPVITLDRNSSSPADADYLGQIKFKGNNDSGSEQVYAKITGKISDASNGTEDGLIEYAVKKAGSNTIVMRITGTSLKLLNSSNLEVDGSISTGGTERVSSSGALSNVTANASIINAGTFADGRIAASNVTQHLTGYQTTLVSGTSIKTINSASLLGSGNISISSGATNLNGLSDVTVSGSETSGQALVSNGSGGFSFSSTIDPLTPIIYSVALG